MIDKEKYKSKEAFKVPDNYFETFTESITQKAGSILPVKTGIYAMLRPHLMLAASMLLLVLVSYATLKLLLPGDKGIIEVELAEAYTEYLLEELDETVLMEALASGDLYEELETDLDVNFEDAEIIEYLLKENINYDDILDIL